MQLLHDVLSNKCTAIKLVIFIHLLMVDGTLMVVDKTFASLGLRHIDKVALAYPDIVCQIRLVEDERDQVASAHLTSLNKQSAIVQHGHLHYQCC